MTKAETKAELAEHVKGVFTRYFDTPGLGATSSGLADDLRVSRSFMSQLANGVAPISPARAVLIERVTNGRISRKDLFPHKWQDIWPELDREAA